MSSILLTLLVAILFWAAVYLVIRWRKPSIARFLVVALRMPEERSARIAPILGALLAFIPLWVGFTVWPFLAAISLVPLATHASERLLGNVFLALWIAAPILIFGIASKRNVPIHYKVAILAAAAAAFFLALPPMD